MADSIHAGGPDATENVTGGVSDGDMGRQASPEGKPHAAAQPGGIGQRFAMIDRLSVKMRIALLGAVPLLRLTRVRPRPNGLPASLANGEALGLQASKTTTSKSLTSSSAVSRCRRRQRRTGSTSPPSRRTHRPSSGRTTPLRSEARIHLQPEVE